MGERLPTRTEVPPPYRGYDSPPEQPIEVARYFGALRRSWLLIAFVVLPTTGLVLGLSLALPKEYEATARIVLEETPGLLESSDAAATERRLATIQTLLTTRDVLARAGRRLPGEDAESLEGKIGSSVDRDANVIDVVATDNTSRGAAAISNAVATEFLAKRRSEERQRLIRARANLTQALDRLRGSPGARTEVQAIRERLSELSVSEASIGSDLQLAEAAEAPSDPSSPHPVRNTIFAAFASTFVAVLLVLARALLAPQVSGPRELSRLLGLPVLVEIPRTHRRSGGRGLSPAEREAFQTLESSIRLRLPPTQQHVVLITSALHGEGKTQVTAGVGEALARAGQKTLLVSADLRRPALHELFDVEQAPGVAEILAVAGDEEGRPAADLIETAAIRPQFGTDGSAELRVLPSGARPQNASQLLTSDAVGDLLEQIKQSDYQYVVVDSAPLLGLVDAQALAREIQNLVIVCRLDRLRPEDVVDLRYLLDQTAVHALGIVVIGRRSVSGYSWR